MTSASNLSSMSRNFTPLMGTFFGLAFKKYGHPVIAIVIGEMIIQLMFNGFVALGSSDYDPERSNRCCSAGYRCTDN
ncbi:hypothetical protein M5E86_03620 [Blautia wexlerae]|nr:hypothetical protein M5E86_03620 [Blautia wexlerae]